ncbi:MAG: glycosyltransferase family 2 protein [Elusimicrobia bacterium]|nr:glycosyltransferase family 2 protein [Elusimicrobiota bacterium]
MIFSIVIPAYNEERAVQDILRRCLAAAQKELKEPGLGVDEVEVILVNDGSRDATSKLAREVAGVRVIDHPKNRGYGAAIKTGFENAKGDWLGFIDCDGTCDPRFFAELIGLAKREHLDIACGSRMHSASRMPPVRVLGNWLYRTLVNILAGTSVTDVASGMRILKRASLPRIYPLPDGMNLTPAMSVRAVLDQRLRIGELPMPYEERVGRSKLSVVKDGFRFLGVILDTAVTYRPVFFFWTFAAIAAALALWALAFTWGAPAAPLPYYLQHGRLEDWMFFRVALAALLLATGAFLVALGAVTQSLTSLINRDETPRTLEALADSIVGRRYLGWGAALLALGVFLNRRTLEAYVSTGHIPNDYWVFPLVGGLCALVGLEFVAFGLVGRVVRLLAERERARDALKS